MLQTKKHWTWWDCVPTIKACFTGPGIMEIFWDLPNEDNMSLIRGYQVILLIHSVHVYPSCRRQLKILFKKF